MLRHPLVNLASDKQAQLCFADGKFAVRPYLASFLQGRHDKRLNACFGIIDNGLPALCAKARFKIRLNTLAMHNGFGWRVLNALGDLVCLFGKAGNGIGWIDDRPRRATPTAATLSRGPTASPSRTPRATLRAATSRPRRSTRCVLRASMWF